MPIAMAHPIPGNTMPIAIAPAATVPLRILATVVLLNQTSTPHHLTYILL
ncbi:hypothetical protein [Halobacillus sp. A5]|nr:hypothetical protein [Halobacillus sp. A5]MCP3029616.1 hypothetical protein [Halobacillus sp. A5]